jgi:Staphylococcus phage HNH endonuclease
MKKKSKHNLYDTLEYFSWRNARARCYNVKCASYSMYGGRGIKMCDEWRNDMKAFYDYMISNFGHKQPGQSIERIDVNGNYEPGNVKWATTQEQNKNKRHCEKPHKDNWTGILGITYHKRNKRWQIQYRGKYEGQFETLEEAKSKLAMVLGQKE